MDVSRPDVLDSRLRIEPATREDLDALVWLEARSFSAPWTRKMFEAELDGNPFATLLIARWAGDSGGGGDLAGYICFWVVFEELRLMNLAVHPQWRRRGIARALVRQALEAGRASGATRAVLEVRASNEAARRLYEAAGFKPFAVRAHYYRDPVEDAVLMSLAPLGSADPAAPAVTPGGAPAGEIGACRRKPGKW